MHHDSSANYHYKSNITIYKGIKLTQCTAYICSVTCQICFNTKRKQAQRLKYGTKNHS